MSIQGKIQSHTITIEGMNNPREFVDKWAQVYKYRLEKYYETNIDKALDNKEAFQKLFEWKNGTSKIAANKQDLVNEFWKKAALLRELKKNYKWEVFEKEFQPTKNATIWKIFLLHLIDLQRFPIYDQHVYRFYIYHRKGEIEEIPSNAKKKYESYKSEYLMWFRVLKEEHQLVHRTMDKAFFAYGKMLKGLKNLPISINNNPHCHE